MATNEKASTSQVLSVICSSPATPVSGDVVRWGQRIGVALNNESATDVGDPGGNLSGYTTVDFRPKIWALSVKGVDDNGNSAVAAGDALFYVDGDTPHVSKKASGYYVGQALEAVTTGSTATIKVAILDSPGSGILATTGIAGADGLGNLGVARATFDPSAVSGVRTIAAHDLGVTLPINSIVVGGFVNVITAFHSATDAGTVAIMIQGANDIITAAAVSGAPYSTTGQKAITPKANTPESTGIKLTAARAVTATVAVEALTAGKLIVFLYYVVSA